jgi:hypothetical protein
MVQPCCAQPGSHQPADAVGPIVAEPEGEHFQPSIEVLPHAWRESFQHLQVGLGLGKGIVQNMRLVRPGAGRSPKFDRTARFFLPANCFAVFSPRSSTSTPGRAAFAHTEMAKVRVCCEPGSRCRLHRTSSPVLPSSRRTGGRRRIRRRQPSDRAAHPPGQPDGLLRSVTVSPWLRR